MFRISRRLDYGLHLLHTLAHQPGGKLTPTAILSKELDIPLPFLHQIAHSLMQAGYIHAVPGPRGGLRLNINPDELSILEIVNVLEGDIQLSPYTDQDEDSSHEAKKATVLIWNTLQNEITDKLRNTPLSALNSAE
ncbi:MAG: Rrf2 family transcriptional regulator [Anaerolineaceae bacterium]|nr:Rrf2 family transcriptional regulator [Anaerolineaceae bacterium]